MLRTGPNAQAFPFADGENKLKLVSLSGVVPIVLAFALTIPALAQDAAGRRIAAAEFDMGARARRRAEVD